MKTRHSNKDATAGGRRTRIDPADMREEIIDWLRDAYSMERGLEGALDKQANNDDLSNEVRQRAAMHLEETRRHAEQIKNVLQSLGSDTSSLKTGIGMLAQSAKGVTSAFARDERIKDLLDAYSMEHFEIACYTALAVAAERAGLPEVAQTCRQIIPDEERMAKSIKESLPAEVSAYLFETATA
jgi:ferritin-like metal-binding protein YciE